MPKLNTIKSNMHKKSRIRVGRGNGSKGTYSGRGLKGQNSRSGGGVPLFFEGGQLPLVKRLPFLRGFKNRFKKDFSTVNISSLEERFKAEEVVNPKSLYQKNLIRKSTGLVKILGDGKLTIKLDVNVHSVSSSANKKITDAGGNIEIISVPNAEGVSNDN